MAPRYHYQFKQLYRIWFSSNPVQFMGLENQKRFARLRKDNPQQKISLISYTQHLSTQAKADLQAFCSKHTITLIDFDDIAKWLSHRYDIKLYNISRLEIENTLNKKGGNLAAASDCMRLIIPVITKLGVYSDFDVECFFKDLFNADVTANAPILLNGRFTYQQNRMGMMINTDFLAFSHDTYQPKKISPAAEYEIRNIQEAIIKQYESKLSIKSLCTRGTIPPQEIVILDKYLNDHPGATLFDFRQHLIELMNANKNDRTRYYMISDLYAYTVMRYSGPDNLGTLYDTYADERKTLLEHSCTGNHPQLQATVIGQSSDTDPLQHPDDFYPHADLSWLPCGAEAKLKRELHLAAVTIQAHYRMFKARKQFLAAHPEWQPKQSWLAKTCSSALSICRSMLSYTAEHPTQSAILLIYAFAQLKPNNESNASNEIARHAATVLRKTL